MLEQSYLAPDHIKTHAYLLVNDLIGLREHDRIQHLDDPPLHRGQRILGLIRVPHALLRHPQVKLAQRGHGPGCWPGTVSVAKGSNEIPAPRRLFQKRTRPASGRCAPLKRPGPVASPTLRIPVGLAAQPFQFDGRIPIHPG